MKTDNINGKYDLTNKNWDIGNIMWDIVYQEPNEDGILVSKRLPLHINGYDDAVVDKECIFSIVNVPNIKNNSEWEDMAVVGIESKRDSHSDKIRQITEHLQSVINKPEFPADRTEKKLFRMDIIPEITPRPKLFTEDDVNNIVNNIINNKSISKKDIKEYIKNYTR